MRPCGQWRGLSAILRSSLGFWLNVPVLSNAKELFFFRALSSSVSFNQAVSTPSHWWPPLAHVYPYAKVCNLAKGREGKPRYALATGVTCLVLASKVYEHYALVRLPSQKLCLVENAQYALVGCKQGVSLGLLKNTKAGFWKNLGQAPVVRGTVKNPNDHPNGGRTRALKYPRTP